MKRVVAILSLSLLAACHPAPKGETGSRTTVTQETRADGMVTHNAIELTAYAMRPTLGNNTTTAAYVTIRNSGDVADRLVSASCACAASATMHTMTMKDGNMAMAEQKDGFVVAPGQSVIFAPGGNHIMLENARGITEGSHQNLVLHFEKAGDVTLSVPVTNDIPAGHSM
ncbi:copper chaperone PCu(A)C [Asticcacaulis solisilvae]|uniref:copper chaperone PCu(A)C n=1 Tax=Asticcacaulis solisilvae TaxID=1217274 RepID=UPI003FD6EA78